MVNIEIIPFDVNSASEQEWKMFHDFRRSRKEDKESLSNTHQITDEKYEETLKIPPRWIEIYRFNVFEEGNKEKQIGEVYFSYYKSNTERELDQKVAMVNISILKAYRHKGYGLLLLKKLVELAKENNKSKMLFQTTEKDGMQMIEDFGATKISEHQQFKLYMDETNWNLVNKWMEKTKPLQEQAKLEWIRVEENIPNEIIDQYTRIFATSLDEHPKWHINQRKETHVSPEVMKQDIKKFVTEKGGIWELGIIREKNGDISGLTELKWIPSRPKNILQLITHIKLHYRGKGRGKILKAGSLIRIRDHFKEVDTVKIGYVGEKYSILYEMNLRLGFKLQYQQVFYEIETSKLESWIEKRIR